MTASTVLSELITESDASPTIHDPTLWEALMLYTGGDTVESRRLMQTCFIGRWTKGRNSCFGDCVREDLGEDLFQAKFFYIYISSISLLYVFKRDRTEQESARFIHNKQGALVRPS